MSLNDAGVESKAPKRKRGTLTQTEIVEHVLDVMLRTHCRDLYQSARHIEELSVTDAKNMLAKADAIVRQFHELKRLIRKKARMTTTRPQLKLFDDGPR
jgi:hypothetical protein